MSIFSKWKKIVKKVVSLQADVLLTIIFFLFIVPLGFVMKKTFDKKIKTKIDKRTNSYWVKKEMITQDLSWAKKQ